MSELMKLALVAAGLWLMWPAEAKPAERNDAVLLIVITLTGGPDVAQVTTETFLWPDECTEAASIAMERDGVIATECRFVDLGDDLFFELFGERLT